MNVFVVHVYGGLTSANRGYNRYDSAEFKEFNTFMLVINNPASSGWKHLLCGVSFLLSLTCFNKLVAADSLTGGGRSQ